MENLKEVIIYTDGACLGNPGPGGYGIVLMSGNHRKEIAEGYRLTTNNRMEILAAIVALKALKTNKRQRVILYSDSRLLVDAINKHWLDNWRRKNWVNRRNADLWKKLDEVLKLHDVEFHWVQGHADIVENERCDYLSKQAAVQSDLKIDFEYENNKQEAL